MTFQPATRAARSQPLQPIRTVNSVDFDGIKTAPEQGGHHV